MTDGLTECARCGLTDSVPHVDAAHCIGALQGAAILDKNALKVASYHRDLLGTAILEAVVKAGIVHKDVDNVSGPGLLMFVNDLAEALVGLAELSARAGEIDAALALYDRAAELDSEDSVAVLAAAKLALGADRTADAQGRFEAVLAEHPREAGAAIELARILAEQGEFEASLDYAGRADWLRAREAEETLAWIEGLRAQRGDAGDAPAASE